MSNVNHQAILKFKKKKSSLKGNVLQSIVLRIHFPKMKVSRLPEQLGFLNSYNSCNEGFTSTFS